MSSVLIDDNNCLLIQNDDLSKFSLHPQWLRERLSETDYVDLNNKQRLYEPSLLDQNLNVAIVTPDKDIIPGADTLYPAYIIFDNYEIILQWNRSLRFGISICTLANMIKT